MNTTVKHKLICILLIVGMTVQGISVFKAAYASGEKKSSPRLLCNTTETAVLFLSLQNNPKTKPAAAVVNDYSCAGHVSYSVCNTCGRNACKSDVPFETPAGATTHQNLYTLRCQFLI